MASVLNMPRLSDSMEEGTIAQWLVDEGAEVAVGDPLVEIETDKATMVFEADLAGTLLEIVAREGDVVPIGRPIGTIGQPGEEPIRAGGSDAGPTVVTLSEPQPRAARRTGPNDRAKASPVARRFAAQLGIDLTALVGSGPHGRVVKVDVLAAKQTAPVEIAATEPPTDLARPAPAAPSEVDPPTAVPSGRGSPEVVEISRLQQAVARRMATSKATAPEFALEVDVDMTECVVFRTQLKGLMDPVPSFNDLVVKACALALREHPRANGAYVDDHFELYPRVNVGVAVAADDALVVPTIFDADVKSLGAIARSTRELAGRVRDGTITPPELSSGTFTVSNLGMFGVRTFTAVINPPQAGILAVGAMRRTPTFDAEDNVVPRELMGVTLVSDHRILYGADSARFLSRVTELLEQPLLLAV